MRIAAFLAAMMVSQICWAEEFTGKVVSVHDGDTMRVEKQNGDIAKIRFELCDTPEIGQPHGDKARDFVKELCLGKMVTVQENGTDQYGRVLGQIIIDGKNVNKELIKEGHAWWFYHYNDDAENGILEAKAKAEKKGLWESDTPIFPRNWRRGARVGNGTGSSGDAGGSGNNNGATTSSVFIMAMMPNPDGTDLDNESVILANNTNIDASIDQWKLEDDDDGVFALTGTIPAGGSRTIRLNSSLQLGNGGDVVRLRKSNGQVVQSVSYGDADSGKFIVVKP